MNEKFKIIDTSPSYGLRYPYTPMPSNGKDARVEIYPPSRLAEGIAFAKEHDIRAVSIVGNGGARLFRLILARLKVSQR